MFLVLGRDLPPCPSLESEKKRKGNVIPSHWQPDAGSSWSQSFNWGLGAELHSHTALVASLKAGKFTSQVQ